MGKTELLKEVELLFDILSKVSTGTSYKDPELCLNYENSRKAVMQNEITNRFVPGFVKKYRDLPSFWVYIKKEAATFEGRRQFLSDTFEPLFDYLEDQKETTPIDPILQIGTDFSSDYVQELWKKAKERLEIDPEGAITAARTLLEATCKFILDKQGISYDDGAELPQLYKKTVKTLNLAPSQHTEQQFRQILGGAESVVNGLSSLRNKLSDAHAINGSLARPLSRHATVCVNMAGTISEFMILTFTQSSLQVISEE